LKRAPVHFVGAFRHGGFCIGEGDTVARVARCDRVRDLVEAVVHSSEVAPGVVVLVQRLDWGTRILAEMFVLHLGGELREFVGVLGRVAVGFMMWPDRQCRMMHGETGWEC
jgi:hypothetical protein